MPKNTPQPETGYPRGWPQPAGAITYQLNGARVGRGNTLNLSGSGITAVPNGDTMTFNLAGGGGSPGGLDTQIQFNDTGSFNGSTHLTFDSFTSTFAAGDFSGSGGGLIGAGFAGQYAFIKGGDATDYGQVYANTFGVQILGSGTGECYLSNSTRLISNQAGNPSMSVVAANGISAAATATHSSDMSGVITTTGTNNNAGDSVISLAFATAYPAGNVPHVVISPLNSAAAKFSAASQTQAYVTNVTQSGFDIQISADAAALPTPSWSYLVIGAHN